MLDPCLLIETEVFFLKEVMAALLLAFHPRKSAFGYCGHGFCQLSSRVHLLLRQIATVARISDKG